MFPRFFDTHGAKKHRKYRVFLRLGSPWACYLRCFFIGNKNNGIYSVFWPAPSKKHWYLSSCQHVATNIFWCKRVKKCKLQCFGPWHAPPKSAFQILLVLLLWWWWCYEHMYDTYIHAYTQRITFAYIDASDLSGPFFSWSVLNLVVESGHCLNCAQQHSLSRFHKTQDLVFTTKNAINADPVTNFTTRAWIRSVLLRIPQKNLRFAVENPCPMYRIDLFQICDFRI